MLIIKCCFVYLSVLTVVGHLEVETVGLTRRLKPRLAKHAGKG